MKIWLTSLTLVVLTYCILVLIGRGSFMHGVLVFALGLYVGVPALVLGVTGFVLRRRSLAYAAIARYSLFVAAGVALLFVSLPLGSVVLRRDIANAKAFCESLVPKIEAYRAVHGKYPQTMNVAGLPHRPPRLLRGTSYYQSNGREYGFSFVDPSGMMNGFSYDPATREWSEWD